MVGRVWKTQEIGPGWAKPQVLEGLTFTPLKMVREFQGQMPRGCAAAS